MRRLITCGLAALTLGLGAGSAVSTTLYRWVDAQGVVHYSDTPQPGAQALDIHAAQTYRAPAPTLKPPASAAEPTGGPPANYQCSISSPTPQQSFFSPEAIAISVNVAPALQPGDQVQVSVDGNPVAGSGQTFQLNGPDRGTHTVSAMVRGADGRTACTAAPVTFDVQRPSLLSPTSPARGH